jgi:hypothetical protein
VLDTALKRARARRPEPVYGPTGDTFGYPLAEESLPIYISSRVRYLSKSKKHPSVITQETIEWFESRWASLETRLEIVCGKDILAELRHQLQDKHGITLTDHKIVDSFKPDEFPKDLVELLKSLDAFRSMPLAKR